MSGFLDALVAPAYREIAIKARNLEQVLDGTDPGTLTVDDLKLYVQVLAHDVYVLASLLGGERPGPSLYPKQP